MATRSLSQTREIKMIEQDQREALQEIFSIIIIPSENDLPDAAKAKIRSDLKLRLPASDGQWFKYNYSRLPTRLAAMRDDVRVQIIFDYVTRDLYRNIQLREFRESATVKRLSEKIESIRKHEREQRRSLNELIQSLRHLLKFYDDNKTVSSNFFESYFGYRRSANAGDLVHFYLTIDKSEHPDVVTFHNRYARKDRFYWHTDGFGFQIGENLYLVGNAHDGKGMNSLGLRCFALRRLAFHRVLNWIGDFNRIQAHTNCGTHRARSNQATQRL